MGAVGAAAPIDFEESSFCNQVPAYIYTGPTTNEVLFKWGSILN